MSARPYRAAAGAAGAPVRERSAAAVRPTGALHRRIGQPRVGPGRQMPATSSTTFSALVPSIKFYLMTRREHCVFHFNPCTSQGGV